MGLVSAADIFLATNPKQKCVFGKSNVSVSGRQTWMQEKRLGTNCREDPCKPGPLPSLDPPGKGQAVSVAALQPPAHQMARG